MLVKLTTLASDFASGSGPWVDSLAASTAYLFNTNNFVDSKVYSTDDQEFRYVFEPNDRQSSAVTIRVTETKAATTTEANYDAPAASQASKWIALDVFEENDTASTAVEHSINQDWITFAETYSDSNITSKARVWVNEGGFSCKSYIVDHTIAAIETLAQAT